MLQLSKPGAPPLHWERIALQPERPLPKLRAARGLPPSPSRWVDRLLRRRPPSLFHRCLAIHIVGASNQGALR